MSHPSWSLLILLSLCLGCCLGAEEESAPKPPSPSPIIRFNGSEVIMLLSGPLRVNFYEFSGGSKLGKVVERVDIQTDVVPTVTTSSKPGENTTTISSISVTYDGISCKGLISNNSLLSQASFSMDFSLDKIKWSLVKISTTLTGSIVFNASTVPVSGEVELRPYIKTGYTPSPVDRAYGRGYTTGSPSKGLSWACNGQEFKQDLSASSEAPAKLAIALEFPGLIMQPFVKNPNGTLPKLGFTWDCDPLISAKIWEVLFIVFILVFIFIWSAQMMLSLNTPSRFDDPKGKPLSVPLHE